MKPLLFTAMAALLAGMVTAAWRAEPPRAIVRDWAGLHVHTLETTKQWHGATYRAVNITGKGSLDMDGGVHLEKGVTRKEFMRALAATVAVNSSRCHVIVEEQ